MILPVRLSPAPKEEREVASMPMRHSQHHMCPKLNMMLLYAEGQVRRFFLRLCLLQSSIGVLRACSCVFNSVTCSYQAGHRLRLKSEAVFGFKNGSR